MVFFFMAACIKLVAQPDKEVFSKAGINENRVKLYRNITDKIIRQSLSLPLMDSTEEKWQGAFWAMELIQYKSPWVNTRVSYAVDSIEKRSIDFQRALLELLYTNHPKIFAKKIFSLFKSTGNAKIFAMCAEYLLQSDNSLANKDKIVTIAYNKAEKFSTNEKDSYLVFELLWAAMQDADKNEITRAGLFTILFIVISNPSANVFLGV